MRQLVWLIALGAIACLLLLGAQFLVRFQRGREARAGLDSALAGLSVPNSMVALKTVYSESAFSLLGETCYYATGRVIWGSSQSAPEALSAYVGMLQSSGWTPRDLQYEKSKILYRGINEYIEVRFGEPGFEIKDAVDYAELGKTYRSLVFARLVYIVPARDGC